MKTPATKVGFVLGAVAGFALMVVHFDGGDGCGESAWAYQRLPTDVKELPCTKSLTCKVERVDHFTSATWPRNYDDLRRAANAVRPDLFNTSDPNHIPEYFLANETAPCWYGPDERMRCLPYFYILGTFHSGTTDLWERILFHPNITRPGVRSGHHMTFVESPSQKLSNLIHSTQHAVAQPLHLTGDASPVTFTYYWAMAADAVHSSYAPTYRECVANCSVQMPAADLPVEPCIRLTCSKAGRKAVTALQTSAGVPRPSPKTGWFFKTPWLLRAVHGEKRVRLIVMVRDPVERVHSSFWFYDHYKVRYGASPEGFLRYVKDQVAGWGNCTAKFGVARCAEEFETLGSEFEDVFFHADQLIRGLSGHFLKGWKAAFPSPSSILVIRSESYFRNTKKELRRVFEHLQVPLPSEALWERMLRHHQTVFGGARSSRAVILPEARQILEDFYREDQELLQSLMDSYETPSPSQPPST